MSLGRICWLSMRMPIEEKNGGIASDACGLCPEFESCKKFF
jgi:hypothetical protein